MARSCAEKSFAATTIGDIVKRASISRGTFYKHFKNKRDCFDATADAFLVELEAVASEALTDAASPTDAIDRATAAVLERLAAKPAYADLLLVEAPNVDPAIVLRYRSIVVAALDALWRKGKEGKRAAADPELTFGRAKVLIVDHLAGGEAARLPSLHSELVYLALLPYIGHDKALKQARL
ncbi:MAG TPA: helix-turn-helix domain-containing protein [Solirubrobacterales bacterium]|nr:helix-turn-helix domain-containing protein [Solirubrobacterales bacterium]